MSVMLSITLRTPGALQAESVASSRSDQLWTMPLSVTSEPETSTVIAFASAVARRFNAASMSDLTALPKPRV